MSRTYPVGAIGVALVVATLLLAVQVAAAPPNPSQPVPRPFLGDWNSKMEDCDSGENDTALSIDPHWIRFYESGGPILATIVMERRLSIIARLTSGEDEKTVWDATMQFEVSANGAVLKTIANGDTTMVRYKCPHHIPPRFSKSSH